VYHIKRNPKITYYATVQKCDQKQVHPPPRVIDSRNLPVTLESRSLWLLGRCSLQLSKSCAGAYPRAERVFILELCFASKSFVAVREAFSNADPGKEGPNKTTIHRLVTTFRDTESVCDRKHVQRCTVLTGYTLCSVDEIFARSLQKSLRRLSQQSGLSGEATAHCEHNCFTAKVIW
jgi:hypothetical protein